MNCLVHTHSPAISLTVTVCFHLALVVGCARFVLRHARQAGTTYDDMISGGCHPWLRAVLDLALALLRDGQTFSSDVVALHCFRAEYHFAYLAPFLAAISTD